MILAGFPLKSKSSLEGGEIDILNLELIRVMSISVSGIHYFNFLKMTKKEENHLLYSLNF